MHLTRSKWSALGVAALIFLAACAGTASSAPTTTEHAPATAAVSPTTTAAVSPTTTVAAPITAASTTTTASATVPPPVFTAAPCPADRPAELQCGTVEVPVDRSKPAGAMMNLAVTIRPATTAVDQAPVLTLTSAGTGMRYSTSPDSAPAWADGRELIWVDRRGAAGSDGTLDCQLVPFTTALQAGGAGPEELAAVSACFAKAAAGPIPFGSLLDLDNVVADLVRVRAALGIKQWVVSTVRSGFDIGVRLLTTDESGVVSLVAADPMFAGGGQNSDSLAASWQAFLDDCSKTPDCAKYGDLSADLTSVLARVKDGAATDVIDPLSGKPYVIHDYNVAGAVIFSLQGPFLSSLPMVVTKLLDPSDDHSFASAATSLVDPTWTVNGAISLGLICQDVGLIMGGTGGTDTEFASGGTGSVCAGVKGVPKVVTPLVAPTSDAPVLIGRGEYSAFSQTERLTALTKPLSNAQIVSIAHVGSASTAGDCWRGMVTAFLAEPAAPLDTACATAFSLPAFK